MNTQNFVIVKTRRDLSGKDITKEWNFLMADYELETIKYKKAKQNFVFVVGHALLYGTLAALVNLK